MNDLTPLAQCRDIEKLTIPSHCKDIEFLRDFPHLEMLDNAAILAHLRKPAAEFWKKWDAEQAAR